MPACKGVHRVLLVDQWTPLGAHCTCLICNQGLHLDTPKLDMYYTGFEHTSPDGPEEDAWIFVLNKVLSE